jgi:hypothetical protein
VGERRRVRRWIGGRDLLGVLLEREGGIGDVRGGKVPNWSQLRRTPISFLPSRRATMSFSKVGGISHAFPFQK